MRYPAAVEAFKSFPSEGWRWVYTNTLIVAGPVTEEQFRDVLRVGGKRGAQRVELHDSNLPESALTHLTELRLVKCVRFVRHPKLTEAGLKRLAALPRLQWLGVHETDVRPAALAGLRGTSATTLDLRGLISIDDAAVEHLAALSALKELNLEGTKVTKVGVDKLAKALPQCRITRNGAHVEPAKKP